MSLKQHGLSRHLDPLDWFSTAAMAASKHRAWRGLERIVNDLGADTVGIVHAMPFRFGTFPGEDEVLGSIVTPEWQSYYAAHPELIPDDILARHLFTSRRLQFIDLADMSTLPITPANAREWGIIHRIADFGLRQSFGVSFADGRTGRISMLMISAVAGGGGDLGEIRAHHAGALHLAAGFFLEGLDIQDMKDHDPPGRLGNRERDCLQWAATGRTTKEIADLTGLSDDTVNEYFASAMHKLGASNRTQAVVRAISLGMIAP